MKVFINYLQSSAICLDVHLKFLLSVLSPNTFNLFDPLR